MNAFRSGLLGLLALACAACLGDGFAQLSIAPQDLARPAPPRLCEHLARSARFAVHVRQLAAPPDLEIVATLWPAGADTDVRAKVRVACGEQVWGPWVRADVRSQPAKQELRITVPGNPPCGTPLAAPPSRVRFGVELSNLCLSGACDSLTFEASSTRDASGRGVLVVTPGHPPRGGAAGGG